MNNLGLLLTQIVKDQKKAFDFSSDKPLPLTTNFSLTFLGNLLYAFSQWAMLSVMAKVGSPEMVGKFSLGLAVSAPVLMFTDMQLRVVQATDSKNEYSFSDYFCVRLISNIVALLVIGGIVIFSSYENETRWVIVIIGVAKTFEALSDVIYGLFQKHERMDRVAISKIIRGAFSFLVFGVLIWCSSRILPAILGLTMVWLLVLIVYDRRNALALTTVNLHFDREAFRKIVRLSLPLGLVMMLLSLKSNIPRYMVEHYWGEGELGYYSALAYLVVVGDYVVSALGQSATPRLARYYAEGNLLSFRKLLLRLLIIGFVIGAIVVIGISLFGGYILTLLYSADYAEYLDVLIWLMIAGGVGYIASFLGYAMSAARYFRVQAPLFVGVMLSTVLACFWLIPRFGLLGAAWASLIAALVNLLGCLAVVLYALRAVRSPGEA